MNIKNGLMLSSFLLMASVSSSNAAVIVDECTNNFDGYGGYSGVSCNSQYSFDLVGTLAVATVGSGSAVSNFGVFGTLTQNIWYEEDYFGSSSSGETTTVLNLNLGDVLLSDPTATTVQYTMTRVDTLLDWSTTTGPVTETLSNTSYSITNPSNWLIETDGTSLLLQLDGLSLVSTDPYSADLLLSVQVSAVPVPAAVWLFASGLLGLVGFAKRKQA